MNKTNKYTRGSRWHSKGQRFDPAYLHQRKTPTFLKKVGVFLTSRPMQREDTRPLHGLDDPTVVFVRSGHRNANTLAPNCNCSAGKEDMSIRSEADRLPWLPVALSGKIVGYKRW